MMIKFYKTKDGTFLINVTSIKAMAKDQVELFDQQKKEAYTTHIINFSVKDVPTPVIYSAPTEKNRDEAFIEIIEIILENNLLEN